MPHCRRRYGLPALLLFLAAAGPRDCAACVNCNRCVNCQNKEYKIGCTPTRPGNYNPTCRDCEENCGSGSYRSGCGGTNAG
eukprot:3141037-Rhodomonas_salina.1